VTWNNRTLIAALGLVAMASVSTFLLKRDAAPTLRSATPQAARPKVALPPPAPKVSAENVSIQRGDTLDHLLDRAGIQTDARQRILSQVKGVFDVRRIRAGSQLTLLRRPDNSVDSLHYLIDPDHELHLSRDAGVFKAAVVPVPGAVRTVPVCGAMQDSLFTSMERVGERPELAIRVAEIFAWDLDFYTDPQTGDQFCVLVEKKEYENGQTPTYRRILAARYNNAGTIYEGFLFPDSDGRPAYYSRDGRSLQSAFLRSPLRFDASISSHFSRHRYHPVLKVYRPHLGTDYAAPVGSPVQAIATGRITFCGRAGGAGKMVTIQHANGYESMYLHLSRILVRAGQHVAQGQRIALVGATGLATGPHLDFRLRRNGHYVDFEHFRAPRATQLAAGDMREFIADRDHFAAQMDAAEHEGETLAASANAAASTPVD
jgi:murein DD-endopeptidase MepM/ murein hydrolase activator NlpD